MLNWKDVDGLFLTKEAQQNGFTYVLYWGTMSEAYNLEIHEGETPYNERPKPRREIERFSSGDKNYGRGHCIDFAEDHAKENAPSLIKKIMAFFK